MKQFNTVDEDGDEIIIFLNQGMEPTVAVEIAPYVDRDPSVVYLTQDQARQLAAQLLEFADACVPTE